jgi:hypothetical protein
MTHDEPSTETDSPSERPPRNNDVPVIEDEPPPNEHPPEPTDTAVPHEARSEPASADSSGEASRSKSTRTVKVIELAAALCALLAAVLAIWQIFLTPKESEGAAAGLDTASAPTATAETDGGDPGPDGVDETPTPTPAPSPTGTTPTSDAAIPAPPPTKAPEPTSGRVPNVMGMSTHDAKDRLVERGFTNVQGQYSGWAPGMSWDVDYCEVIEQDPVPDTVADFDDPIVLTYFPGSEDEDCGM